MEDLVSVIVPVYNSQDYLEACVDSIIYQTYNNLDIILVDDGSTDSSAAICDAYAQKDSRVQVIHKENGGNGDARNAGLKIARGQWIVMSDNDDILHRRQIEVLLAVAHDKNADISVGWYRSFEVTENPKDIDIPGDFLNRAKVLTNKHLYSDQFIAKYSMILTVPWCKLCRRALYDGIRYPAKSRHDDTWTTWKLYEKAKKTALIPLELHHWRNDPNSFGRRQFDTSHFDGIDAYREQLEYFHREKKQRYVEIVFDEYVNDIFWCYNRMKESEMDPSLLRPYWKYMKRHLGYIRLTKSLGFQQWLRYRYLAWYKMPKLLSDSR